MALLGLSILIASVSFLCYRHPPSTWAFLEWLRRPSRPLQSTKRKQDDAPKQITEEGPLIELTTSDEGLPKIKEESIPTFTTTEPTAAKDELDRKAMPPPPPPTFKKSTSPTTPRASTISTKTTVPSFALADSSMDDEDTDRDLMPPPSFPALNSAQRASGGARAPPRLGALSAPSQNSLIPNGSTTSRNTNLMSPPSRGPIPNRSPAASSSIGLAPPPTHNSIPTKPRKKVLLTPNHSPLDWARLTSNPSSNLTGLPPGTPYLRVPPSLLKQMTGRKGKDAWTVLGGKVYNITPYLPYHPGGEPELMRCAGRDGTKMFGEVHPWVNWEGMLEGCLVGVAVSESEVKQESPLEEMD